jgi:hypothetical protein
MRGTLLMRIASGLQSIVASLLLLLACGTACSERADNRVLLKCSSGAGLTATVIERSGGGAAGYVGRFVTIGPGTDSRQDELSADSAWRSAVFSVNHSPAIRLTWRGNRSLHIEFASSADVTNAEHRWPRDRSLPAEVDLTYASAEADRLTAGGSGASCTTDGN